jgi:hypothetical protein
MRLGGLLLSLCLLGARVAAQVPAPRDAPEPADTAEEAEAYTEPDTKTPWRTSYFPYLTGGTNDGPVLAFRVHHFQPAEYEDRVTTNAALTADAGVTHRGSRHVSVRYRAPQLWENWRLSAFVGAGREARFGYFGIGNETVENDDAVTPEQPFLYRVRRARYGGKVEVTRRIKGPWQAAFLANVEWTRFTTLPGPSLFRTDFGTDWKESDVSGRLAMVYDTRDNEFNTHQGLLLEAGAQLGSGNDGYTRLYSVLRGYLSVREGTVIAARLGASALSDSATLNARYHIPSWENQIPVALRESTWSSETSRCVTTFFPSAIWVR